MFWGFHNFAYHWSSGLEVDWPAWITAFGTLGGAVVLAITARYAYKSANAALNALDDARNTRHAQLLTDLSRRWDEPLIVRSRKLFGEYARTGRLIDLVDYMYEAPTPGTPWYRAFVDRIKHGESRPGSEEKLDDFYALTAWPNLIETIGVLESERAIDGSVVYKMWGSGIIAAWSGWCDAIERIRDYVDQDRDTTYAHFQRLAGKMAGLRAADRRSNPRD
jgi:hypothetical protein